MAISTNPVFSSSTNKIDFDLTVLVQRLLPCPKVEFSACHDLALSSCNLVDIMDSLGLTVGLALDLSIGAGITVATSIAIAGSVSNSVTTSVAVVGSTVVAVPGSL